MKQICCDRCGKEASIEDGLILQKPVYNAWGNISCFSHNTYDLCNECLADIGVWIRSGKNDKALPEDKDQGIGG